MCRTRIKGRIKRIKGTVLFNIYSPNKENRPLYFSEEELISGSRRKEIEEARVKVAMLGVKRLGFSGAEIARYLGVTSSCINRIASSVEMDKSCDEILKELMR